MEGHALSQYTPGQTYDVSRALGEMLIVMSAAIEVRSTDPALATSADVDVDVARLDGGIHVTPPDKADDHPRQRRSGIDRRRTPRSERRKM
jgi:hypothetical protein